MRRLRPLLGGVLGGVLGMIASIAVASAGTGKVCGVTVTVLDDAAKLKVLPEIIEGGGPVTIDVLGAGTSAGTGASNPAASYPARLEIALADQLHRQVRVVNHAIRRQTAADMRARIRTEIAPDRPALVIWEIGTVDAVVGVEPEDFAATLKAGLTELMRLGSDVLLVEPQYAAATASVVNLLPFVQLVRQIGHSYGIPVFPRYDLTAKWIETGFLNFSRSDAAAMTAEIDKAYDCVGRLIAWQIDRATTRWPAPAAPPAVQASSNPSAANPATKQ